MAAPKKKINKNKNNENVPYLEITEVVLVHRNIVNNCYQHDLRVLYTLVPNKLFGQLLNISPKNFTFLKTCILEFSYVEIWFIDQNSKPLKMEDKINITLVINWSVKYKNDSLLSSTKRSNICKRLQIFLKIWAQTLVKI